MEPFYTRFPELVRAETRVVFVPEGHPGLPSGSYVFIENYCADLECDCRRVILTVIEESDPQTQHASINYGWEKEEFYARWLGGDREGAREIACASIDPMNPQTDRADGLLDLFQLVVLKDRAYVKRLEEHYWMFKRAVRQELTPSFSKKKKPKLLKR